MKNLIFILFLSLIFSCKSEDPKNLGPMTNVENEALTLSSCDKEKECFSSFENSADSLLYNDSKEKTFNAIKKIIQSEDRIDIKNESKDYIHAIYDSGLSGLHDLEFVFTDNKVEVKSQSRATYLTFSKGKKMLERISFRFHQRDY